MPGWLWAVIIVAVVIVVALVAWQAMRSRRTRTLQGRFGREYDRTLESADSKRDAEADLAARAERHDSFEIRPLAPAARERYAADWERVQARFVDDPEGAVREADGLIQSVMADRGYPVDDFDQRAADLSVDHPDVVEHYREGQRLARAAVLGDGTTEELRLAMQHFRSLFDELLGESADMPAGEAREREEAPAPR
jgi:hypothetical protein